MTEDYEQEDNEDFDYYCRLKDTSDKCIFCWKEISYNRFDESSKWDFQPTEWENFLNRG